MNKKIIVICAAVLIALFAGWYTLSPAYAFSQLQEAAEEGDRAELEERVDFNAIRTSMKEQMKAQVSVELMKEEAENPLAAMGGMMAMGMVDSMIDAMVTPEMIIGVVKEGRVTQENLVTESSADVDWDIERDGISGFTVHLTDKGERDARMPSIVFKRDGLGWKLVDIRFPTLMGDDTV